MEGNYIIFDTETTGLPTRYGANFALYYYSKCYDNARLIQICWAIYDKDHNLLDIKNKYIKPNKFSINNSHIHGITDEVAKEKGENIEDVLTEFIGDVSNVSYIICHNTDFDCNIIKSEFYRLCKSCKVCDSIFDRHIIICTLKTAFNMKKNNIIHSANLGKVYMFFFNEEISNAHDANFDVLNTAKIFKKMLELGYINLDILT